MRRAFAAVEQGPEPHCQQTSSTYIPGSRDLLQTHWQAGSSGFDVVLQIVLAFGQ